MSSFLVGRESEKKGMMGEEGSEGEIFFFSFWVFLGMRNEREGYPDVGVFREADGIGGSGWGGWEIIEQI